MTSKAGMIIGGAIAAVGVLWLALRAKAKPPEEPLPSIDIVGFKYLYFHGGYYHLAGLPGIMVYPEKVGYIGFSVLSRESVDIDGVTVAFKVIDGGEKDISSPVTQWPPPGDPVVMTPPFTVPYASDWRNLFTFDFIPVYPQYKAVAMILVNGVVVDYKELDFTVG